MSTSDGVRGWRIGGELAAGKGDPGRARVEQAFRAGGLGVSLKDRRARIHHDQEDLDLDAVESVSDATPGHWLLSAAADMDESAVRRFVGRLSEARAAAGLVHRIELYDASGRQIGSLDHGGPKNPGNDGKPGTS